MTVSDLADELCDHCRDVIGENLRAVTGYSSDEHNPYYTREDVPHQLQLEDGTRQMFRHPLMQMNKAVWQLSDVHPTLDTPDVAVYSYGSVSVIQFPMTKSEGVIVTLDCEGGLPAGFLSRCRSIVYGRD